jgi:DNA mismatch repair protein MutL
VEVRQLFFNLPARRKFLRTEETEAAHIQHYLTLAALAYSEVAFTFIKDGRSVWQLAAIKSERSASSRIEALRERLRALMGDEKLLPVNFTAALDDTGPVPDETDIFETALPERPESAADPGQVRVWGLIGTPGVSRATRDGQFVFVNRRPVENRGINYALIEGYHTSLMKGRYPVCCLFLEINPASVDVNIHPAKREVKFHREFEIRKFVARAVGDALLAYHTEAPKTSPAAGAAQPPVPTLQQTEILPSRPALKPDMAVGPGKPAAAPATLLPVPVPSAPPAVQAPLKMGFGPSVGARTEAAVPAAAAPPSLPALPAQRPASLPLPASASGGTPLLNVPLRLIGVVGKLYVLLESDRGLVLLDQHAAHERILFEQMLARLEQSGSTPSQKLLLPETIELPPRDAQFLREQLTALTRLGVGLSEFGERTFLLDALPPFVRAADPRRFVFDLVDELRAAGREVNLARLGEHTVAKTVCRHAVKANDYLAAPELENLINDLRHCAMPYTCPHGRPTLIEMNYRELEKKFGRTQ